MFHNARRLYSKLYFAYFVVFAYYINAYLILYNIGQIKIIGICRTWVPTKCTKCRY